VGKVRIASFLTWFVLGFAVGVVSIMFYAASQDGGFSDSLAARNTFSSPPAQGVFGGSRSFFSPPAQQQIDQVQRQNTVVNNNPPPPPAAAAPARQGIFGSIRSLLFGAPPAQRQLPPPPPPPPSVSTNPNPYSGKFGLFIVPTGKFIGSDLRLEYWYMANGYNKCDVIQYGFPTGDHSFPHTIAQGTAGSVLVAPIMVTDPDKPPQAEALEFECTNQASFTMGLAVGDIIGVKQGVPYFWYGEKPQVTASAPIGAGSTPGPRFSFQVKVDGKTVDVTGDPVTRTVVTLDKEDAGHPEKGIIQATWKVPDVYKGCVVARPSQVASKGGVVIAGDAHVPTYNVFHAGTNGSATLDVSKFLKTKQGIQRLADPKKGFGLFNLICAGPDVAPSVATVRLTIPLSAQDLVPNNNARQDIEDQQEE